MSIITCSDGTCQAHIEKQSSSIMMPGPAGNGEDENSAVKLCSSNGIYTKEEMLGCYFTRVESGYCASQRGAMIFSECPRDHLKGVSIY